MSPIIEQMKTETRQDYHFCPNEDDGYDSVGASSSSRKGRGASFLPYPQHQRANREGLSKWRRIRCGGDNWLRNGKIAVFNP